MRQLRCYRCGAEGEDNLPLLPLAPQHRQTYPRLELVMRQCKACGLSQNHFEDHSNPEPYLNPWAAAAHAPAL